jgi:hypothetical protein
MNDISMIYLYIGIWRMIMMMRKTSKIHSNFAIRFLFIQIIVIPLLSMISIHFSL